MRELQEENRTYMSHTAFNPIFDIDGESGTGHWYFDVLVVFDDDTASWARGTYNEEYRKVDDD